jgi:hypothetical protein
LENELNKDRIKHLADAKLIQHDCISRPSEF